jgi:hypothetical protein
VLAVFQSVALNATCYSVGEKQHADGLLCLVQTASLLRVMHRERGEYHPSCHPAPSETCFPKGQRLFLPHSSSSPGCFFMDCLSGAMMALQSSASVELHTWPPSPSNCSHHLVIFIPASLFHVSSLLNTFKTNIIEFSGNCMMLQT